MMSRVLSVSRAGFYAWLAREPSARAQRREALVCHVEQTYHRYKRRYGAPRLTLELNAQGVSCSENHVAKLLRSRGLRALNGRRFRHQPTAPCTLPVRRNLLARDFVSTSPNRKWVSDITYIPIGRSWAYLAVVLDLYSRKVVGWALDTHMRETLILEALTMAIGQRQVAPGLLGRAMVARMGIPHQGNVCSGRRPTHRDRTRPSHQVRARPFRVEICEHLSRNGSQRSGSSLLRKLRLRVA